MNPFLQVHAAQHTRRAVAPPMKTFRKHTMVCPKWASELPQLQQNISRIICTRGSNYQVVNAYGQVTTLSKVEVGEHWFDLFPDESSTLAPYESLVFMSAVIRPKAGAEVWATHNSRLGGLSKINAAITRIKTKRCLVTDSFFN